MGEEIRVDPGELVRLADEMLDLRARLAVRLDLAPPGAAEAVDRLLSVCEGDVDRLHRAAFTYRRADRNAADRSRRAGSFT